MHSFLTHVINEVYSNQNNNCIRRMEITLKNLFFCICSLYHLYQVSFSEGRVFKNSTYLHLRLGTPLQYSCLENPMDGGAWKTAVHGVAKSRTRLSNFTFTFTFMHWRKKWQPTPVFLPGESQGLGEPGGLPSMGSHGVRHDWSDLAAAAAADSHGCMAETNTM